MELEALKIRIGFSKPRGKRFPLFSWIVRLVEGTPYSHVYLRWFSQDLQEWVCFEADHDRLQFKGYKAFKATIDPVFEYELECPGTVDVMKWCIQRSGLPYATFSVLGMLWVRLFGVSNPLGDGEKTQFCSEVVLRFLIDNMRYKFPVKPDNILLKNLNILVSNLSTVRRITL